MFISKINFNFNNLKKDSYIKKLPYINIKLIKFTKNIIFITGDNGIGKTTLLEVLAYDFNLNKLGGSKNFILNKDNEPEMFKFINISKSLNKPKDAFFFRSDTFFKLQEEINKYSCQNSYYSGNKSFHEQSHGEGFMSFFKNRIGNNSLYFFDEPETALSFDNKILFLFLLKHFENQNNQIFIITHSPILLSYPNAQIININKDSIFETKFENTNQFKNIKEFIENYKSYQNEIINFK